MTTYKWVSKTLYYGEMNAIKNNRTIYQIVYNGDINTRNKILLYHYIWENDIFRTIEIIKEIDYNQNIYLTKEDPLYLIKKIKELQNYVISFERIKKITKLVK